MDRLYRRLFSDCSSGLDYRAEPIALWMMEQHAREIET
jgi:hypothetical protein